MNGLGVGREGPREFWRDRLPTQLALWFDTSIYSNTCPLSVFDAVSWMMCAPDWDPSGHKMWPQSSRAAQCREASKNRECSSPRQQYRRHPPSLDSLTSLYGTDLGHLEYEIPWSSHLRELTFPARFPGERNRNTHFRPATNCIYVVLRESTAHDGYMV